MVLIRTFLNLPAPTPAVAASDPAPPKAQTLVKETTVLAQPGDALSRPAASSSISSAPSKPGAMKLTEEQYAICQSKAHILKVKAGAGTGKTSTLRALAQQNQSAKILYVAFNKSIQLEAERKFTKNVRCRTAHALAFARFGKNFGNVAEKLQQDMKPFHIRAHIERTLRDIPDSGHTLYGARVIEAVKNFLVSGDGAFDQRHVSIGGSPIEQTYFDLGRLRSDAERVWALMQDVNSNVPMLHDGYLKLYQLSAPSLPYDIILFDEAQDTNPVTQAIVEAQRARKIYVGDTHQAIYSFRGAADAMARIKADEEHSLTGSFRFGAAVAEVANAILDLKGDDFTIRGLGAPSRIRELDAEEGYGFISRSNAALFNRAVQCVRRREPYSFVGDVKGYRFDQILDVYNLANGRTVKDPFIGSFDSYDALAEYADAADDREIKSRCRIITTYEKDIPRLVQQVERRALPYGAEAAHDSASDRRIVMMTAHKCKGLEFDRVQLANDFMELVDEDGVPIDMDGVSQSDIEEINLQYVAVTRAQGSLHLCESIESYLELVNAQPRPGV